MKVSPRIGFNGFLTPLVVGKHCPKCVEPRDLRRSNVPTTEIEFDDRDKSIDRVFNVRHWEECIRVSHEASCS